MTALDAAVLQEGLRAGERLLMYAVGSGVGTAALQLGRALGAQVIGTSRSPAKLRRAQALGVTHAVLSDVACPRSRNRASRLGLAPARSGRIFPPVTASAGRSRRWCP